jgi:ectoine hydroxylase-related dioxygenase (phytanoyl-CoA dioxygenase family)
MHVDTRKRGVPDEHGYYVCTAAWMLDDFTPQNGATRIVPGTHKSGKLPKEVMADPNQPHPDEIVGQGKAGDVLVFNGHCWHAGGRNSTDHVRRAILVHYIRGDHPQDLDQKEALSPETQAKMTPHERQLLGLDG